MSTLFILKSCENPKVIERTVDRIVNVPVFLPGVAIHDTVRPGSKTAKQTVQPFDSSAYDIIEELLAERDRLNDSLSKYATETASLDTVHQGDTININYELYSKAWLLEIKYAQRSVPVKIQEIVKEIDNTAQKYQWGIGGYLLGIVTVICVIFGT